MIAGIVAYRASVFSDWDDDEENLIIVAKVQRWVEGDGCLLADLSISMGFDTEQQAHEWIGKVVDQNLFDEIYAKNGGE